MFGCCNSFKRDISLIAVDGMPSSSASNLIFFRAKISPVTRSLALYTTPIDECAMKGEFPSVLFGQTRQGKHGSILSNARTVGSFTNLFHLLIAFHDEFNSIQFNIWNAIPKRELVSSTRFKGWCSAYAWGWNGWMQDNDHVRKDRINNT